jgi:hypothetical protein
MNKIKKIISLIVFALFLSALTLNLYTRQNQFISPAIADHNPCPGWDGSTAFCGVYGQAPNPCQIVAKCVEVCPYGCD